MKKLIITLLILCLVLTMAIPASAITTGSWDLGAAQDSVNDAAQDMIQGRTIAYDYNGGWYITLDGWRATLITEASYTANGSHTIPDTVPWRYGCTFTGWLAPNGVIYQPGDLIQGTGNVTLVAQWEARR